LSSGEKVLDAKAIDIHRQRTRLMALAATIVLVVVMMRLLHLTG